MCRIERNSLNYRGVRHDLHKSTYPQMPLDRRTNLGPFVPSQLSHSSDTIMRTLADVKRAVTLGTTWTATSFFNGHPYKFGLREVTREQRNAVAFRCANGRESWLQWPRAKDVRLHRDGKGFDILVNGERVLTYQKAAPVINLDDRRQSMKPTA